MTHANLALQQIINQSDALLAQLDPSDYRRPLEEFDGSSLGQHFRHILEFLQCLAQGVDQGLVDYAARERNLLYEENPALAADAFQKFSRQLEGYAAETPIAVKAEFGSNIRPEYQSSLGRELLFVYDHAIHHLAIIKIGLNCQFPGIKVEKNFGVSPSTIKSRLLAS